MTTNVDARSVATMTIDLARAHLDKAPMRSSAALCLSDAEYLDRAGRHGDAAKRALASLSYSAGIFHVDYLDAKSLCDLVSA